MSWQDFLEELYRLAEQDNWWALALMWSKIEESRWGVNDGRAWMGSVLASADPCRLPYGLASALLAMSRHVAGTQSWKGYDKRLKKLFKGRQRPTMARITRGQTGPAVDVTSLQARIQELKEALRGVCESKECDDLVQYPAPTTYTASYTLKMRPKWRRAIEVVKGGAL